MLTLIGNAPSSGSTLLADLLDASNFSACGPELGLFASSHIYGVGRKDSQPTKQSGTATLYTTGVGVYRRGLPGYGLNDEILKSLCDKSRDFEHFAQLFTKRYLALRGKHEEGAVFEKTPQNINSLAHFLSNTSNGRFLFLTRDPLYVHRSLQKRGYSTWQAIGTWLIAAAKYMKHKANSRVEHLRYEDVIQKPFEVVAEIIERYSRHKVAPNEVRKRYEESSYRQIFESRVKSWGNANAARVGNSNQGEVATAEISAVARMLHFRVGPEYAKRHDLAEVSLEEALVEFGYEDCLEKLWEKRDQDSVCSREDKLFLLRRWGADMKRREAKLSDVFTYLHPLVPSKKTAA